MFEKIQCILSTFFLIFYLFMPNFASASVISCSFPGTCTVDVNAQSRDVMQETEERYGFDKDILRTMKRKDYAPRVEIFFDSTNPKPGEKVTANAVPEYFKNDPQNLYYTWYIIHTKDGKPQTATNSVREGKIEASRVMSVGDYDPELDGQTYPDKNDDPDKDGWPLIDSNSFDEDHGAAPMGGADGVGGLEIDDNNIEPYDNAGEYCDTKGGHGLLDCNLNTEKSSFNQYYNMKTDQSGNFCKACQSSLSFTGMLSPTGSPAGVNSPDNQCCYLVLHPEDPTLSSYDPGTDYCPSSYYAAYEACFDYSGLQSVNSALINSCLTSEFNACKDSWDSLHQNPTGDEPVSNVSRCYKHNFGTNLGAQGFRGYSGDSNDFGTDESGTDVVTDCKHKWTHAPGYTSASGKFPTGEEEYWKTDPTDPDTDGDGLTDEADIIGLGQETFSWNYRPGDRVGVVVEGTSIIPIDEQTAYYKIMWGYPDICDGSKRDILDNDECESSDDYGHGFLATRAPNEEQTGDKLKVSLSFTPDNPVADPSDENKENISSDGTISDADQIMLTSSLDNTNYDPQNLYYTWQISKSTDLSGENWTEVKDIQNNIDTKTATSGLGLSSFTFAPKKKLLDENTENIVYFKLTLTVTTASDITTNRGRTSVIIPVNKNGIKVGLLKVDIEDGKAEPGDEVCTSGLYKMMCPAVQNQMLAAKVTSKKYDLANAQFSWTLNGEAYSPPANASQYFSGLDSRTVIFPVALGEQEVEDISVTATPKNDLAPVTGSRAITVVHPAAFIRSADEDKSWQQINTVASTEQKNTYENIVSDDTMEALADSKPSYRLDFVPDYLLQNDSNVQIDWLMNGASIHDISFYDVNPLNGGSATLSDDDTVFSFPTDANQGAYYTLSANVRKFWSDGEKKILSSVWNIEPMSLDAQTSVSINTVGQKSADITAQSSPGQMLAAIGTHLPEYLMYNLRLALTILVMFFVSSGFYALSRKIKFGD